uniref:EF-hand domain-containing protein n=1 Tax=Plectus sambesii TaxID=2011161 RepID=A0A914XML6_9BILA
MAAEGQSVAPQEVFDSVDANNDGLITKEEAEELVKKLNLNIDQEAVEKLFQGEEAKETISFAEFETLLQSEA